jgi:hypothetical protein
MAFHGFEFDPVNRVLLARVEGRLTETVLSEYSAAIRKYALQTDALAGIFDFSLVTNVEVSSNFIRDLAGQAPSFPNAMNRPRIIVAPQKHIFGLSRMFQIMGEETRPLLQVVHTIEKAFSELDVKEARFQPLE